MNAVTLLANAVQHLGRAAVLAEESGPDSDALAGQIRLAAATIPATWGPDDDLPTDHNIHAHLEQALDCLDQIPPLDGPPDLPLIAWHVHELERIAALAGIP